MPLIMTTETDPGDASWEDAESVLGSSVLEAQLNISSGWLFPDSANPSLVLASGLFQAAATDADAAGVIPTPGGPSVTMTTGAGGSVANGSLITITPGVISFPSQFPLHSSMFLMDDLADVLLNTGFVSPGGVDITSNDPGAEYVLLQFDTDRGDTTFQIAHKETGQTLVDTGVIPDATTVYAFQAFQEGADSFVVKLYSIAVGSTANRTLLFEAELTTELPGLGITQLFSLYSPTAAPKTSTFVNMKLDLRPGGFPLLSTV